MIAAYFVEISCDPVDEGIDILTGCGGNAKDIFAGDKGMLQLGEVPAGVGFAEADEEGYLFKLFFMGHEFIAKDIELPGGIFVIDIDKV